VTTKRRDSGYNERLFSPGLRGRIHSARFRWLASAVARHGCAARRVLELGCFDGKSIDYLPSAPEVYEGFDADWEGGLALARARWAQHPNYRFHSCDRPEQLEAPGRFDVAIMMETLEHLPPAMVEPYLRRLAELTQGCIFATVPNEKGIVFLAKYLIKRLAGEAEPYRTAEVVYATLGQLHKVARHEHKGFDYRAAIAAVGRHFDVLEVSGYPLPLLPAALNFGVCIVGRSRRG
jgi:2-polyprenyl-3-methyl-5-hydroxy-6-metoxy-1,4-benzoquinol methylase